jgi:hypothetical protein
MQYGKRNPHGNGWFAQLLPLPLPCINTRLDKLMVVWETANLAHHVGDTHLE